MPQLLLLLCHGCCHCSLHFAAVVPILKPCCFFMTLSPWLDCATVLAMLMAYSLSLPVDCHFLHAHHSHRPRRCHRLLHCNASWHSLHCCFFSLLLAACYCQLACCGMPMCVSTQCQFMLTVPHHSRRGLSHHFIIIIIQHDRLYLYSCDWE